MSEVSAALVEPAVDPSDTSTALVDDLAGVAERMREAGALYARWRAHPAAARRWPDEPWGTDQDARALDDLRGIDFGVMDATFARMTALATAAEAVGPLVAAARAGLEERWDNRADQAAALRLSDFASALGAWRDSAGQLGAAMEGARRTVASVLRRWADEVRGADARVSDPSLRHAHIDLVDAALDAGHTPQSLRTMGIPLGGDPVVPSHEVLGWLDDFAARHSAELVRLRRGALAARDAVEQVWGVLGQVLAEVPADPFAVFAPPEPAPDETRVTIRDGEHSMVLTGPDEHGRYELALPGGTRSLDFSNGPVRFTDGDTAVTATLVGDGKVAITLDDGDGPPVTYTVDASGDEQPEPVPAETPVKPSGDDAGPGGGAGGPGGGSAAIGGGGAAGADAGAPTPVAEGPSTGAEAPAGDQHRAAAPAAAAAGGASGGSGGGMGGGMPMGGGMGAGAGQGQGGDNERKQSAWRIAGNIFDDKDPASGFDGIIGIDPGRKQA
ncbi:hypothetical protein [Actinokineospora sp. UTMC 2448]|uniref:hypothetical protein n=1 Tax=Actinokineospora sp. UTMC 2448 TaxID=2268449 RepID=UPI0021647D5D|nr:hypothetical protein [Actinokineospora sp. UTMC 2448]UVS82119.1 hypothetical protein Actkin_05884 [Actinokineospora sp. UTMC 2448]